MVRVNRNKLPKKELEKLFKQLNENLGKLSARNTDTFLQELLGQEERLTIAKRLAAIVMLLEGYSLYRISESLKISSSTANRISDKLDDGSYDHLVKLIKKDRVEYQALLDLIESILSVGGIMPSRAGLDRYRGI